MSFLVSCHKGLIDGYFLFLSCPGAVLLNPNAMYVWASAILVYIDAVLVCHDSVSIQTVFDQNSYSHC